jgi:hypothetical protein
VRAGHSSVAFTLDRYGHLYEDAEDDIRERLDALFNAYSARHARANKVLPMRSGRRCPLTCGYTGGPKWTKFEPRISEGPTSDLPS